jgi:hypothetical protein
MAWKPSHAAVRADDDHRRAVTQLAGARKLPWTVTPENAFTPITLM